jgi:uncharacterized protein
MCGTGRVSASRPPTYRYSGCPLAAAAARADAKETETHALPRNAKRSKRTGINALSNENEEATVTFVRISLHESSHSHRRQQLHQVLQILRDRLRVRGLIISQGVGGIDLQADGHFETLGDLLRRVPDPRLMIEFFDEPVVADQARQVLRQSFPDARIVSWRARCEQSDLRATRPAATSV